MAQVGDAELRRPRHRQRQPRPAVGGGVRQDGETVARRRLPGELEPAAHGATRVSPDIRLQRWFEAPPDVVFDAYTDPDAQRDLRAGGLDWVVESL
jgi:hypothetical protein